MAEGWHTCVADDHPAARLLTARAVRERCARVMAAAEQGATDYFTWREECVADVADYVVATIRERYPDLAVPFHSRWRHFEVAGADRWGRLAHDAGLAGAERARARIDLAVTSVLLDAGAGAAWRYVDRQTGESFSRSEGLGLGSFALFAAGAFSSDRHDPLRVDARALAGLDDSALAGAFQVSDRNPLVGLAQRGALMRRLGSVVEATPAVFGTPARPGNLYDYLRHQAQGSISAGFLLETLLRAFGPVWPHRCSIDGVGLGDCWPHPAAVRESADPTDGFVPLHKLSQWLAYSLLEPLEEAGLHVAGIGDLTGLAEYRNGGLLLDLGAIAPRSGTLAEVNRLALTVDHPAVVEWRALTVIGLDRVADAVREHLGLASSVFPLARVLEGGTWAAGRKIAAERRADGSPPLRIASDGTVF